MERKLYENTKTNKIKIEKKKPKKLESPSYQ